MALDGRFSIQDIENVGTDRGFNGFPMREAIVYNPTSNTLERMVQPTGDSKYATNHLDDYTTTSVTYVGQEDKDGTWKIIKIDETGNFPVFTYASISNNATKTTYSDAWTDRVTLTYNVYSTAF